MGIDVCTSEAVFQGWIIGTYVLWSIMRYIPGTKYCNVIYIRAIIGKYRR